MLIILMLPQMEQALSWVLHEACTKLGFCSCLCVTHRAHALPLRSLGFSFVVDPRCHLPYQPGPSVNKHHSKMQETDENFSSGRGWEVPGPEPKYNSQATFSPLTLHIQQIKHLGMQCSSTSCFLPANRPKVLSDHIRCFQLIFLFCCDRLLNVSTNAFDKCLRLWLSYSVTVEFHKSASILNMKFGVR